MVQYAKDRGCTLQVDTTTNAALLDPKTGLALIEAGLDRINISINGLSDESYRSFTRRKVSFERLVDNVRRFYEQRKNCLVCVKMVGDNLPKEEHERFLHIFGDISDRIFIEHIAPCWPTFEMTEVTPNMSVGIYGQDIHEVEVCPYIFYSMSINSDGRVSLCFLDWARRMIIGDARSQSLKDIWNGKTLRNYQRMHLAKNRRSHAVCGTCGQLSHGFPDDIDSFADILLKRLEGKTHG